MRNMKIDQSVFIKNLVIKERLTAFNANFIPMKAESAIEMIKPDDYEKINLCKYQRLVSKLMYLAYGMRPNITFIVGQRSKHNADPRLRYLPSRKKSNEVLERNHVDRPRFCRANSIEQLP